MAACISQVAALVAGFCIGYRLGLLHGNREVAALLRWLLTQVSLYTQ